MSRNTYDVMVYGAFVEALEGLAKVRKQNITKKLIIMEIQ